MVGKLSRLPHTTLEALRTLACLGNTGNTSTLALVHGTSEEQLHSDLWEALPSGADRPFGRFVSIRARPCAGGGVFAHSRSTARPGASPDRRLLKTQIPPDKHEDAVFEIVGHFNRATALITSPDEREQVAALDLLAGKRAKKAAAFASALSHAAAGAALLERDGWRRRDLVFELELHRAESEFLTGDVASAEQRLRMLSPRAISVIEQCAVACLQASVYIALQEPARGLSEGLECLRQAGLELPLRPTEAQARVAYDRICSRLDGVGLDEVAALPMMTDPASGAILELLAALSWCAASTHKPSEVVILCAAVDLVLDRGIHEAASWAFAHLGYQSAWFFDDFDRAFHFGQLGYELIERTGLRRFEGLVCLHVSTLVMPWARHATQCRPLIRRTFEVADNTGNRFLAVAGGNILLSNLLLAGDPLADVAREAEVCLAFCRMGSYGDYFDTLRTQAALIRSLRGLTRRFGSLDDDRFDERRLETQFFDAAPHRGY